MKDGLHRREVALDDWLLYGGGHAQDMTIYDLGSVIEMRVACPNLSDHEIAKLI